jgi:hypothetical protein
LVSGQPDYSENISEMRQLLSHFYDLFTQMKSTPVQGSYLNQDIRNDDRWQKVMSDSFYQIQECLTKTMQIFEKNIIGCIAYNTQQEMLKIMRIEQQIDMHYKGMIEM